MGVNIRKSHESTYWGEHEVESLFQRRFCQNFVHTMTGTTTKTPSHSFQESYASPDGYFTFMGLKRFSHCLLYYNKQAPLSLQPSFSVSSSCFAWILCCLLQIRREEIGWPHLTLRVSYKSSNSTNSFVISNIILLLQAKNGWADSHWARNPLFRAQRKMRAGTGHVRHTSEFPPKIEQHYRALTSPSALF